MIFFLSKTLSSLLDVIMTHLITLDKNLIVILDNIFPHASHPFSLFSLFFFFFKQRNNSNSLTSHNLYSHFFPAPLTWTAYGSPKRSSQLNSKNSKVLFWFYDHLIVSKIIDNTKNFCSYGLYPLIFTVLEKLKPRNI